LLDFQLLIFLTKIFNFLEQLAAGQGGVNGFSGKLLRAARETEERQETDCRRPF